MSVVKPVNAGKPWTRENKEMLLKLVAEQSVLNVSSIASHLQRTDASIRLQLEKMACEIATDQTIDDAVNITKITAETIAEKLPYYTTYQSVPSPYVNKTSNSSNPQLHRLETKVDAILTKLGDTSGHHSNSQLDRIEAKVDAVLIALVNLETETSSKKSWWWNRSSLFQTKNVYSKQSN